MGEGYLNDTNKWIIGKLKGESFTGGTTTRALDANGNLLPEVAASLKTIPQGAATTVWCATSPLLNNIGGVYCEDADIASISVDDADPKGVSPYSLDESSAKKLWALTEEMTGIKFTM